MSAAVVALVVSIGTSVFWIGWFFGSLKGKLDRTRAHLRDHGTRLRDLEATMRRMQVRARDLEKAHSAVAQRPFITRYPEDTGPLPGETPYLSVVPTEKPEPK